MFQTPLLLTLTLMSNAFSAVDCPMGYEPSADRMTVLLDEENQVRVLLIGYTISGGFYEVQSKGCKDMRVTQNDLLCNNEPVGTLGPVRDEYDDVFYNGPRASVALDPQKAELSGACDPKQNRPLTVTFKP